MNRLQTELQRLYRSPDAPEGQVQAMVLELARPASWEVLARAWQGVQADLELPAPAIAVSGSDGIQLWFSCSEPVPIAQAMAFLQSLCRRYLGDVKPERIVMQSAPDASVPPIEVAPGRWSAFVASDLASLFADEPWLDLPPGNDAQADLLSRLQSMTRDDWQRAMKPGSAPTPPVRVDAGVTGLDPRRFLLQVMNDPAVELHLRIEAAKALLPHP